jgi:hypothetical protein
MQVGQDSVNGILFLNTGDNPDSTSAAAADLDVYVEDAFQPLGPGHRRVALCWRPYFCIFTRLQCLAAPGRGDLPTPAMIRR